MCVLGTVTAPSWLTCGFLPVDEDVSGLTFEEWVPSADTDTSEAPVAMIVNSSELRAAGFDLREVIPLQLEAVRGVRCTRGAALKQIHGMGTRRYPCRESAVYDSPQQPWKN